jgi:putative spermidine/putrescine transport system ATP-binding protein
MSEDFVLHLGPRVGSETVQRLASVSPRTTSEAAASAVSLRGVERRFGAVRAVDGVDLDVRPGEFFAMLGPSGSGKTTCLRLIGGFDQPTAGRIEIFGEAVESVPVYRRPVNTVFQDYALFPHMNVLENVCYGLMIRRMNRAERHRLGLEALKLVKLVGLEARKPGELSGGQRQRVALARALVLRPKVLLLDEPLGALDLKLREAMQSELKSLQRSLGLTFVFVTHDQGEALSMADRVAVFNHGRVVQIGTPEEIYERPRSRFVADFVGGSNVIEPALVKAWTGVERAASVRPEKIALIDSVAPARADFIVLDGSIAEVLYHGAVSRIELVTAEAGPLFLTIPSTLAAPQQGAAVRVSFSRDSVHFMELE